MRHAAVAGKPPFELGDFRASDVRGSTEDGRDRSVNLGLQLLVLLAQRDEPDGGRSGPCRGHQFLFNTVWYAASHFSAVLLMSYRSSTVSLARTPIAPATPRSARSPLSASARASSSSTGTRRPSTPSSMIASVAPGSRVAIDGRPQAIASSSASGCASRADGSTNTSAARKYRSTSLVGSANTTSPAHPCAAASARIRPARDPSIS